MPANIMIREQLHLNSPLHFVIQHSLIDIQYSRGQSELLSYNAC